MNMQISIIIPVYNVENYIKEMLNSVINQTLDRTKYEIIVIDDKSLDSSYDILKEYEKKIDILLQNEINLGLGATRNKGLKLSQGKYTMFLDSDDLLINTALEKLLEAIENTDSDIVQGNYKRFNSRWSSLCVNKNLFKENKVTTLNDTPELLLELTAWNKLYRKSFLREIEFKWEENRLYEDMYPNFRALYLAKKICIIKEVVYMWRVRENTKSITQKKAEYKNLEDRLYMLEKMYEYSLNEKISKNILNILEQRICIDMSYHIQERSFMTLETSALLDGNNVTNLFLKISHKNIEVFKEYRSICEKADKKRYAILQEFLTGDISEIISHNKFSIIVDNEKYLKNKLNEISNDMLKWCSFYVIGKNNLNLVNVKYVENFSEIDKLLNTYIIYNEEFKSMYMLDYLNELIGQRMINLIVFNKNKIFLNHEDVSEYQNASIPIFLSLENNALNIDELFNKSTSGKNNIFYHSNIFYKYSDLLLKYKNSKLVYKIYNIFKK